MNTFAATRRSLHGIAELLIAGPQHRAFGTIRLRVADGGFEGARLPVRVRPDALLSELGSEPLRGTYRDLAERAGLVPGAPEGVYHDTSGVDLDEEIAINTADAAVILGWFVVGDGALKAFAPDSEPVLWPEHFDLGISLDEVNYGMSPGDSFSEQPYAYVGPWTPREGAFWNAPFGAARTIDELHTADDVAAFFAEGRALSRPSS